MAEPIGTAGDNLEPTLRGFMTGSEATALGFARWDRPQPRGRVVIAHGYGEHGERYRHTALWLNGLGWMPEGMSETPCGPVPGV